MFSLGSFFLDIRQVNFKILLYTTGSGLISALGFVFIFYLFFSTPSAPYGHGAIIIFALPIPYFVAGLTASYLTEQNKMLHVLLTGAILSTPIIIFECWFLTIWTGSAIVGLFLGGLVGVSWSLFYILFAVCGHFFLMMIQKFRKRTDGHGSQRIT